MNLNWIALTYVLWRIHIFFRYAMYSLSYPSLKIHWSIFANVKTQILIKGLEDTCSYKWNVCRISDIIYLSWFMKNFKTRNSCYLWQYVTTYLFKYVLTYLLSQSLGQIKRGLSCQHSLKSALTWRTIAPPPRSSHWLAAAL